MSQEIIPSNLQLRITKIDRDQDEVTKMVSTLRELSLKEFAKNSHLYDQHDFTDLETSGDLAMISYLESQSWNLNSAFETLRNHAQWRKENKVRDLKAQQFPRELHAHGMFHPYGFDKLGHPLLFIRLSTQTGPKELNELVIKHFLWVAEFMRDKVLTTNKRFALIYDCRNPAVDIRLIKDVLSIYTQRYPLSLAWIAFIDMSSSFRLMFHVIKYFFPKYIRSQMMTIDSTTLRGLVDEDNIPIYLGGNNHGMALKELENCPTFLEYAKSAGLANDTIKKGVKHFSQFHS